MQIAIRLITSQTAWTPEIQSAMGCVLPSRRCWRLCTRPLKALRAPVSTRGYSVLSQLGTTVAYHEAVSSPIHNAQQW